MPKGVGIAKVGFDAHSDAGRRPPLSTWRTTAAAHRLPLAGLLASFVLARVLAYVAGVRFDRSPLPLFGQYLDPEVLKTHLLQSVFYLHSQPPLFNLFLGGILKLSPAGYGTWIHLIYVGLGLALGIGSYALMVRLDVGRWVAAVISAVIVCSPTALLFENWLFYEYPIAVLVAVSVLAFSLFVSAPSVQRGMVLFGLLATVVLTRTMFQLVWVLGLLAILLLALPRQRRTVLIAAAVPLLLVCVVYAKNVAVFGTPTPSWLGLQLAKMTVDAVPSGERADLVRRKRLSAVSAVPIFSDVESYRGVIPPSEWRGVPALDRETKPRQYRGEPKPGAERDIALLSEALVPRGSNPNYNNIAYVEISRRYFADSLWVIGHRPEVYADSVGEALRTYFRPSTDYAFVSNNRAHISAYEHGFNTIALGRVTGDRNHLGFGIVAAYIFATFYGAVVLRRLWRDRHTPSAREATLLAMWLTILYVTLVSCLTEILENQRDRITVDTLVAVVCARATGDLIAWRRLRSGSGARARSAPP